MGRRWMVKLDILGAASPNTLLLSGKKLKIVPAEIGGAAFAIGDDNAPAIDGAPATDGGPVTRNEDDDESFLKMSPDQQRVATEA